MYTVNKGNFVGRQGAHKIDGLVREERREGWTREAQMIEGVGNLGIQARRGQETSIACSTAIEGSLAFVAKRPIHEPAHDNRRIDNEPRSRHGGLGLPVTGVARFDKFLDGIGQLREVDAASANPVMDGRHALPRAAHLFGRQRSGHIFGSRGPGVHTLCLLHLVYNRPAALARPLPVVGADALCADVEA